MLAGGSHPRNALVGVGFVEQLLDPFSSQSAMMPGQMDEYLVRPAGERNPHPISVQFEDRNLVDPNACRHRTPAFPARANPTQVKPGRKGKNRPWRMNFPRDINVNPPFTIASSAAPRPKSAASGESRSRTAAGGGNHSSAAGDRVNMRKLRAVDRRPAFANRGAAS